MKTNQKGFGVIQIVLLLVLALLIVGTGVYVYKAQNEVSKTNYNADRNSEPPVAPATQKDATTKEEDNWYLFEASDKAYSVRVPDGWEGVSMYDNVYVRDPAKLAYQKGTKAIIETLTEGGWDGPSPFAVYLPRQNYDQIVKEGTKEGDIQTDSGLKAEKYKYIQTEEQELIGYQKGDTAYNYYFGSDGKYIQVTYYYREGGVDQHELVERLIKTIKVNQL